MRRKKALITFGLIFIFLAVFPAYGKPGGEKKIYHNEKWDILMLYPEEWTFIEDFGDKIPVAFHAPRDIEPDGFVMFYFIGQKVVEDLEELAKYLEEEWLESFDSYEIFSVTDGSSKEGFPTKDYYYSYVDGEEELYSNCRILITDEDVSWMILFDRPPDAVESVVKEGKAILQSAIFAAAEYLAEDE